MPPHDASSRDPPPPRPNRGHQPSFSAALLDAIYHSLEAEAEAEEEADADARPSTEAQRTTPVSGRRRRATPEPSPSRCSSVRSPRLQRPPRPCRVRPDPQPNNGSLLLPPPLLPPHEPSTTTAGDRAADYAEKRKSSKKKKMVMMKSRKTAPLACLLDALLCNRRPATGRSSLDHTHHTPRATATAFPAPAPEPASARSILSSRASRRDSAAAAAAGAGVLTPARRAVRFSPVATVVDDEPGQGVRERDAGTDREMVARAKESAAAEAERRVEELLRALGVAEERERAKESSESSSDLFELDGLPASAFQDTELPRSASSTGAGLLLARPRPRVQ